MFLSFLPPNHLRIATFFPLTASIATLESAPKCMPTQVDIEATHNTE